MEYMKKASFGIIVLLIIAGVVVLASYWFQCKNTSGGGRT